MGINSGFKGLSAS